MGQVGRPKAIPASVELDYAWEEFCPGPYRPDFAFYLERLARATLEAAQGGRQGRLLDVACGDGREVLAPMFAAGWQVYGLDASTGTLRLARDGLRERGIPLRLVRGIAEALPFANGAFDRITCKGSLDHFAAPEAFVAEAARVLRPGGRLVVALNNYESLSCRLGRLLVPLWVRLRGYNSAPGRPYWQPPADHTFKGDYPWVLRLGGARLRLVRCYGVSLLSLLPGWGWLLARLPPQVAWPIMAGLDRLAGPLPALSDAIVTVWATKEGRK